MPSNSQTPEIVTDFSTPVDILVGPRRSIMAKRMGVQPMSAASMKGALSFIEQQFGHKPIKSFKPQILKTKSTHDEATEVHKFRMDFEQAAVLAQTAGPNVSVEVDSHLRYGSYAPSSLMQQLMGRTNFSGSALKQGTVKIRIIGEGDKALEGVSVTMEAAGFPQEGVTDSKGEVVLKLFEMPGANLVSSVFVRPKKGHWNRILNAPALTTTGINVIRLKSLADTQANFTKDADLGWGQKMMGLDVMPDEFTGKGVKIAIIDSGADTKHPSLKHIKTGFDMTNDGNTKTWADDVIGHGSHCAGIITGNGPKGEAVRGFAPDAEIIVMKVFPGGQFSSLLDALSECIRQKVDVVNMSLGGGDASEIVEQQIEECVQHGICCIVAAGNSGNEVQYPAQSPSVLAVSALGQIAEVPADTWEASTRQPEHATTDGLFSPSFTCHGPEIGVTGPGVGIISSVPGAAFDPQSGTSMAAPHICGMAALLMAHHPDFKVLPRDASRVAHMFAMLKGNTQGIAMASDRVGSGMPILHNLIGQFTSADGDAGEDVMMATAGPITSRRAPSSPLIYPAHAQPAYHPAYAVFGACGIMVTPQGIYYH
jgi:subtilisin family serine protease